LCSCSCTRRIVRRLGKRPCIGPVDEIGGDGRGTDHNETAFLALRPEPLATQTQGGIGNSKSQVETGDINPHSEAEAFRRCAANAARDRFGLAYLTEQQVMPTSSVLWWRWERLPRPSRPC
jgi:hypothetical protein